MDATRRFLSAVQTWLDVGAGSDNVVRYCARDEGGHKAVAESLANCEHAAAEVIGFGDEALRELTAAGCRDEARLAARIVHLAGRPFGWRTVAGNWPDDAAALHVAATAPGFSPRTSTAPVAAGLGVAPPAADAGSLTAQDDATKPRLPRRQRLAYYSFKYVQAKLRRRVEDREAYEYLQKHGIELLPDNNEDAKALNNYELPDRFDTWASYLSAGRKTFDDSKYTPRHARRSGGSVVRAADVESVKRDE